MIGICGGKARSVASPARVSQPERKHRRSIDHPFLEPPTGGETQ